MAMTLTRVYNIRWHEISQQGFAMEFRTIIACFMHTIFVPVVELTSQEKPSQAIQIGK